MKYQVWRQDDNGVQVIVLQTNNKKEAEDKLKELEARGHKQMYWMRYLRQEIDDS